MNDFEAEVAFKMEVEPMILEFLDKLEWESENNGIHPAWFQRAVFTWAMEKLAVGKPPSWLERELARIEAGGSE